jgi:hypothetical protein
VDIRGFTSLLFEILVGKPANDEQTIPLAVPWFACKMIEAGLSLKMTRIPSFQNVSETLEQSSE